MALTAAWISTERAARGGTADVRLRMMMEAHLGFVGRTLRRLGVPENLLEDAAQTVFLAVARRLDDIEDGKEKAFLFGACRRVASDTRRTLRRHPDYAPHHTGEEQAGEAPDMEHMLDRKRARELIDLILDEMPSELREVFVLFELEGLSVTETSRVLGIARGTASSRLTRARKVFRSAVQKHAAALKRRGS